MVTASYPTGVISYADKKDRVDVVDDDHINQLQIEQIALQQYVGTSPQGDRANLADRLNAQFDGSGFILGSTGFPADTTPRKIFYRNDSETLYIAKSDNTGYKAVSESFSNTVWSWSGVTERSPATHGLYFGTGLTDNPSADTSNVRYAMIYAIGTTYRTLKHFRFTKISGINNLTLHARLWAAANTPRIRATIAGTDSTLTGTTTSSPTWNESSSIDVSGLTNGTDYACTILLSNSNAGQIAYCSDILFIAS